MNDDQDINQTTPQDQTNSTPVKISTTPLDQTVDKPEETLDSEPNTVEAPDKEPAQDFGQIEVQQYDAPAKRPLASLEETLGERPGDLDDIPGIPEKTETSDMPAEKKVVNFRPSAMPPIRADNPGRAIVVTTTMAIVVLLAGFAAGFGGFQMLQGQTATADVTLTPEAPKTIDTENTTDKTTTPTVSAAATADWLSYANTKYSYTLKYPSSWFGQGIDSATSNSVQVTSFKPSANSSGGMTEGYKVEIVFQDTNAKLLADWLAAHNASMNAKVAETKDITLSTKTAIEQTLSAPVKSKATYVIHADKVMIISYYAADKDFDKGLTTYENILGALKLGT